MKSFVAEEPEGSDRFLYDFQNVFTNYAAYHRSEISAQGLTKSGKLLGSITAVSKAGSSKNDWKRYVLVSQRAGHHIGHDQRPEDQGSPWICVEDRVGLAQVVAPSPATIGVNDWFDYQKTKDEFTASGALFNQSVTLNLKRKTSAYELITESGDKIFSPLLVSADITAVGGGASGGSPYYQYNGAGAGAGGEIKTLKKYDMKKGSETALSITVGVGGESVHIDAGGAKSGIPGGTTTVKNGASTILSAAGGTGGNAGNGASGGTSSNGGNGGAAGSSTSENATNGGDATADIFDDPSVGKLASGGGGGTGYGRGENGTGGAPNGGAGSGTEYGNGEPGKIPGGGGGAGSNRRPSGAGANGGVYMRFYWE